jgi:hypothetical protein
MDRVYRLTGLTSSEVDDVDILVLRGILKAEAINSIPDDAKLTSALKTMLRDYRKGIE